MPLSFLWLNNVPLYLYAAFIYFLAIVNSNTMTILVQVFFERSFLVFLRRFAGSYDSSMFDLRGPSDPGCHVDHVTLTLYCSYFFSIFPNVTILVLSHPFFFTFFNWHSNTVVSHFSCLWQMAPLVLWGLTGEGLWQLDKSVLWPYCLPTF